MLLYFRDRTQTRTDCGAIELLTGEYKNNKHLLIIGITDSLCVEYVRRPKKQPPMTCWNGTLWFTTELKTNIYSLTVGCIIKFGQLSIRNTQKKIKKRFKKINIFVFNETLVQGVDIAVDALRNTYSMTIIINANAPVCKLIDKRILKRASKP
jgi:hypothetical protein